MVPRTSSGRGFKGAAAYYLHDKGASTSNRVSYTATLNLVNDNPRRAVAEMIYTAEHANELKEAAGVKATGRKLEKPVYTFSLSWHPTEKPDFGHMREAGISALKALKMDHHQVLMVAHNDTEHPHMHFIVNRIDPNTGKAHGLKRDQLILSKWAEAYEMEHGQTWCVERVKNNQARQEQGKTKFVKDKKDQERDSRPEYDQRAKAIAAQAMAKAAQSAAAEAQRNRKLTEEWKPRQQAQEKAARRDDRVMERELYRAREIEPVDDPKAARAAFAAQQKEDRRRAAFELWQTECINALQSRQEDERGDLGRQHSYRRLELEQTIKRHYGTGEIKARLSELQERENGTAISRWLDKIRGLPEEREALQKNLANAEQRAEEMRAPMATQEESERRWLAEKHDEEKQKQVDLFQQVEQNGFEIPSTPQQNNMAVVQGAKGHSFGY